MEFEFLRYEIVLALRNRWLAVNTLNNSASKQAGDATRIPMKPGRKRTCSAEDVNTVFERIKQNNPHAKMADLQKEVAKSLRIGLRTVQARMSEYKEQLVEPRNPPIIAIGKALDSNLTPKRKRNSQN